MPIDRHPDGRIKIVAEQEIRPESVPGLPCRVVLRFANVDGRAACVNVEVGAEFREGAAFEPQPITTSTLRAVPLARLIEQTLRMAMRDLPKHLPEGPFLDKQMSALEAAQNVRRPGRPPRYDEAHFAEVARVYREHGGGRAPTKAVAEHFTRTRSTAATWVSRARALGLLEPVRRTEQDE